MATKKVPTTTLTIAVVTSDKVFPLEHSINHTNKFERGNVDAFFFKDVPSVGKLESCQIYHDNTGVGPGWHLKGVEVHDLADNMAYYFQCNQWLAKDEGDKKINRTLPLTKSKVKAPKHTKKDKTTDKKQKKKKHSSKE